MLLNISIQAADASRLSSDNVIIEVTRLGNDDKPMEVLQFSSALDNSSGKPKLKLSNALYLGATTAVVLNITYPGYVQYSRRFSIEPLVFVDVVLAKAGSEIADNGSHLSLFGLRIDKPIEGFSVKPNGLNLYIPRSLVSNDVEQISAETASLNPVSSLDSQYFPGEYRDNTGNSLVPVAFDYIKLVSAVAPLAKPAGASTEVVLFNRTVPTEACRSLAQFGDAKKDLDGFQVPFYRFNSATALWQAAGFGTLYTSLGERVASEAAAALDCAGTTYVVNVEVDSQFFSSHWWSLAYPLSFNSPAKFCAIASIQNNQGEALAGMHGLVRSKEAGLFGDIHFTSDAAGHALLEVTAADSNPTLDANLVVVNDGVQVATDLVFSRNCSAAAEQKLILNRPRLCQIQGQTLDNNGDALKGYPVIGQASDGDKTLPGAFDFAVTDYQGLYWLNLACNRTFELKFFRFFDSHYIIGGLIVDAKKGGQETRDDGTTLILPASKITPIPTGISSAVYSSKDKEFEIVVVSGRSNFPITYTLDLVDADNKVLETLTGKVAENGYSEQDVTEWFYGLGDFKVNIDLADNKKLKVTGTLTDAKGKVTRVDDLTGAGTGVPINIFQ